MSFRLVQMYLFQFAVHQGGHVEAITAHSFEYDARPSAVLMRVVSPLAIYSEHESGIQKDGRVEVTRLQHSMHSLQIGRSKTVNYSIMLSSNAKLICSCIILLLRLKCMMFAFYEFLTLQFNCWRGIFIFMAGSSQSVCNSIISLSSAGAKLQLEFVCIAHVYQNLLWCN